MKMLSLFSGIGGIDLAAQWAGIETVAFCEKDKFCQKVLAKHWPNVPIFEDVKTLTKEVLENARVGRIDIVAGGFPCQPFSLAGKRGGGEQDSRHLWPEMRRIIHEIRPAWVIGENVPGLISMGLEQVLIDLENEGYEAQTFNIPACGVNAPHKRARIFIVAHASIERERRLPIRPRRSFETAIDAYRSCENVSDTDGTGRKERDATAESNKSGFGSGRDTAGDVPDAARKLSYGSGTERNRRSELADGSWWDVEPGVCRVVDGVPNRTHRLRALGNAVVPQQIYPVFKAIMEVMNANQTREQSPVPEELERDQSSDSESGRP